MNLKSLILSIKYKSIFLISKKFQNNFFIVVRLEFHWWIIVPHRESSGTRNKKPPHFCEGLFYSGRINLRLVFPLHPRYKIRGLH